MVNKFDLYNTPPEENEDELGLEEEPSQSLSEANDDTQLEYTPEQPSIETEPEADSQPLTAQERYANVLKQASEAGPRASDYRGVALGKLSSALGAGMGGYMESMAGTMFHRPNFKWMDEGRKEVGDLGEYNIKAKEAEKKRLVDKAAGIRQEALLPGEIAAQEIRSQEAQARLEALKPASQEELDDYKNLTGTELPAGTTRAALAKFREKALTPMSPYEKGSLAQRQASLEAGAANQEKIEKRAEKNRSEGQIKTFSELMRKEAETYKKSVKREEESLTDAEKIATLARSNDWQSFNAVAARFAKVIGGDSGVLTDKDISRYADSPAIVRRAIDTLKRLSTGVPSEETKQGYIRAVEAISKTIKKKIADRQKEAKNRIKNDRLFKALEGTDQEINDRIFGGSYYGDEGAETSTTPTQPKQPAGGKKETESDELKRLRLKFGGK